jgi:hypothetical protein
MTEHFYAISKQMSREKFIDLVHEKGARREIAMKGEVGLLRHSVEDAWESTIEQGVERFSAVILDRGIEVFYTQDGKRKHRGRMDRWTS